MAIQKELPHRQGSVLYGEDGTVLTVTNGQIVTASEANIDTSFNKADTFVKCQSVAVSASGLVKATPGFVVGFFVVATSSGTFALRDNGASGTVKLGGPSNAVATATSQTATFPAIEFGTNIYFQLVSGSAVINIFYI